MKFYFLLHSFIITINFYDKLSNVGTINIQVNCKNIILLLKYL